MRQFLHESSIRTVVHEMVAPLIKNQIQNRNEVTKALGELKEVRGRHEEIDKRLDDTIKELGAIPGIQEKIREVEDSNRNDKRSQKVINDQVAEKIDRNRDRAN